MPNVKEKEEYNVFIPEIDDFDKQKKEVNRFSEIRNVRKVNLAEHYNKNDKNDSDFKINSDEIIDFSAEIEQEKDKAVEVEEKRPEKPIKYIGEAFRTYIIIEYDDERIMFIDKHAAHERLIYERLKKQNPSTDNQMLIEPLTVTLEKNEYQTVLENKDMLFKAGFDIDDFGNGRILIRSVPLLLEKLEITEAFLEISDYLQKHKKIILSEKMEWIYQNTACRAAIKAGNVNKPEELIHLAIELEENPDVKYCPHGRPIYFFISKNEIEKNFKRV